MGGLACRSAGKRFDAAHDSEKGRLPDTLLRESHHRAAAEKRNGFWQNFS
jgi:hypothetical protein